MSQDAFAEACGVRRRAQAHYESGERYPDAQYLEAATKIGVDLGELFSGRAINRPQAALMAETYETLLFCIMFALGYEDHEAQAWVEKAYKEAEKLKAEGKDVSAAAETVMGIAQTVVKKSRLVLSR